MKQPESICILRLSALGDVCNAAAAVQAIQTRFPEASITWIIGKVEHQLVRGHEHLGASNVVDAVVRSTRKKRGSRADCLETVEEIGVRLQEDFVKAGGKEVILEAFKPGEETVLLDLQDDIDI